MTGDVKRLGAAELKRQLHDGGEIALLDAREEGVFHARHLLLASCVPLGRLELLVDDLVPRRATRVVWCDDGDGSALRAARRMSGLGYTDVAVLEGGIAAWEAAGYRLYSGVHVPSKAFAEVVEHEAGTPWISAPDLKALIDRGADIAIFDSRSYEEYHNNSIPTATSVPGAELVLRFTDMVPSPDTTVIVNCGGRTRSIIGAQALRNAGVRNKIMSLKDGTMAWHLAGLEVVKGATRRPAGGVGGRTPGGSRGGVAGRRTLRHPADRQGDARRLARRNRPRTLYLLDVRTPEEYRAGHLAGARSAPGGQLVQETDAHIATWNARVVLVDDNGVRATMTASWLKQMGFNDVAVLADDGSDGDWTSGPHVPRVLGLDPAAGRRRHRAGRLARGSGRRAHGRRRSRHQPDLCPGPHSRRLVRDPQPPRPGSGKAAEGRGAMRIVLTSPDGALARLAAADLATATAATAAAPILVLEGGTEAWAKAGLPIETGASHMASEPVDVVLSARERGVGREEAMREYLAWEIDLVNQMAEDDDQRFRVVAG